MKLSLKTLLNEIIDYAGLFPPAGLDMDSAASNYAAYRKSSQAWMLARFIVPAARLQSLAEAARELWTEGEPWRLSVLIGEDAHGDARLIEAFSREWGTQARVEAAEARAGTPRRAEEILSALGNSLPVYFELAPDERLKEMLLGLDGARAWAKIRTGGITPELIPGPQQVAFFMHACAEAGVPFKMTAGLHHPLRSLRPLTYEDDAPQACMHGFLNAFLAACWVHSGRARQRRTEELLMETNPASLRIGDEAIAWRGVRIDCREAKDCRRSLAHSFGSCSFQEPIDDLKELDLL